MYGTCRRTCAPPSRLPQPSREHERLQGPDDQQEGRLHQHIARCVLKAGWIENALGEDVFLEVPEDEGAREPYRDDDLSRIFSHRIFTAGFRFSRTKACGDLQFWLPLIACLHGMISSEILQLGPDTLLPPDAPDVLCFEVTIAGDRRVKTLVRRRRGTDPARASRAGSRRPRAEGTRRTATLAMVRHDQNGRQRHTGVGLLVAVLGITEPRRAEDRQGAQPVLLPVILNNGWQFDRP